MSQMRDRMRAGEIYKADDPDLKADYLAAQRLVAAFNATSADDPQQRTNLLSQLLGSCGDAVVIQPPLRCDYGQYIHIGEGTFVNYDAVLLDVMPIRIGAFCQIAPRVQILTATHPMQAQPRRQGWESGAPVTIGDNVWLGAGVIVLPGVHIGDNTVVGAGSVVTHDLPANVVAMGTPARPVRPLP